MPYVILTETCGCRWFWLDDDEGISVSLPFVVRVPSGHHCIYLSQTAKEVALANPDPRKVLKYETDIASDAVFMVQQTDNPRHFAEATELTEAFLQATAPEAYRDMVEKAPNYYDLRRGRSDPSYAPAASSDTVVRPSYKPPVVEKKRSTKKIVIGAFLMLFFGLLGGVGVKEAIGGRTELMGYDIALPIVVWFLAALVGLGVMISGLKKK